MKTMILFFMINDVKKVEALESKMLWLWTRFSNSGVFEIFKNRED